MTIQHRPQECKSERQHHQPPVYIVINIIHRQYCDCCVQSCRLLVTDTISL